MATDKTGEAQGSSSSGKAGGGKNISALLKKLKGKINKDSGGQKNLQTGANKSTATGLPVVAPTGIGPTSNPDMPFVGADAQKYLVDSQLKGFGFGKVVTDFSPPATGFGAPAAGGFQPTSFGTAQGTPPVLQPIALPTTGEEEGD